MLTLATVRTAAYTIIAESESSQFSATLSCWRDTDDIEYVTCRLDSPTPERPNSVSLRWEHALVDTHLEWYTEAFTNRHLLPEWNSSREVKTKNTYAAPVMALMSSSGENRLTFALSDAFNPTSLFAGVVEETACALCRVRLFVDPMPLMTHYEVTLRLDTRPAPFHRALADTASWWASLPGYTPAEVPDHARLPMYSTWYSFHQRLSPDAIEKQCRLAYDMGMRSVIVDDGWQTDDNNRGYAYTGDWEVTPNKFPDFAAHVKRVHDIGMKYVLWFSVPYVGSKSRSWERFKDKCLCPPHHLGAAVLDPRFPDVREYLITLYESFLDRYDIDGFKLDFVDTFWLMPESRDKFGDGRDFESVPDASDALLTQAMKRLRARKPHVLVEFRQSYVGPLMRKYGNMFRAADVPNDFHSNRVRTVDVRLLSGNTPAHSDMVMWHPGEPVESAAMQLVHTLFSVPQVSVMLDTVPSTHAAMIRAYLRFWTANRDVLLNGEFMPTEPGLLYPTVCAATADTFLGAAYGASPIVVSRPVPRQLVLVNGSFADHIILDLRTDAGMRTLSVYSCIGERVHTGTMRLNAGLHTVAIPPAGHADLEG